MKIIILALALASTAFADPSIPRTLYMTHGAPTAASDSYLARIRNTNPTFDVIDYDDDAAAEYIHEAYANTPLPGVYDAVAALGRPVMLADLFRLAVIAREGGFYLDADVRTKKSLEPLINDAAVFPLEWYKSDSAFAERHEGAAPRDGLEHFQVGNYAFGAAPGHPLVADALAEATRRSAALVADRVGVWGLVRRLSGATHAVTDLEVLRTTGPYMLSEVYHGGRLAAAPKYADVTLLRGDDEPPTATRRGPNDWHKFGSFAEHTLAHSWVDDRRLDEEYGAPTAAPTAAATYWPDPPLAIELKTGPKVGPIFILKWTPPADHPFSTYRVQYKKKGSSAWHDHGDPVHVYEPNWEGEIYALLGDPEKIKCDKKYKARVKSVGPGGNADSMWKTTTAWAKLKC